MGFPHDISSLIRASEEYSFFSLRAKFMEIKSILKLKVNSEMEMKNHCLRKKEKRKNTPNTWKANCSIIKAGWRVQGASAASELMSATSLCRCSITLRFETLHVIMGSKKPTVTRGNASAAAFCVGTLDTRFFFPPPIQIHECTWITRWMNFSRLALHKLRCEHFLQTF